LDGAYVSEVVENSAAQKAGIKSGDVIVNVNGVAIKTSAQLQEQIGRYSPGDKITVDVLRNNKTERFNVELKNLQGNTSVVSTDFNIDDLLGAKFKAISDKQKEQYKVEYGVVVESVTKGRFQQQGIRSGFVIVKINNQNMRTVEDIQTAVDAALNSTDSDKVLFIAGVYPNGRVTYYAVNLAD
jgi:S1-C subfamily serine protease